MSAATLEHGGPAAPTPGGGDAGEARALGAARAGAPRRRRFGRALQAGIPRIAAGARRDVDRDQPSIFERRGEHAGAALAEVIVAAAAVDPADTRLEADAAAEARRPQDRAD